MLPAHVVGCRWFDDVARDGGCAVSELGRSRNAASLRDGRDAARARPTEMSRQRGGAAMTDSGSGWELGKDGQPLSIPIWPRDLGDVREWCREHCRGDYVIVLARRVAFERREDAALATLYWRAEQG